MSVLDNDMRWGTQFLMLDRMIELRPHLQDMADCGNSKLHMTEYDWNQAIGLRDLLKHAYKVTKELQFADLTPGTFYKKWTSLRLIVENQGLVREGIAKSMKAREKVLLENGLLLAGVLVDVQNLTLLTPEHEHLAIEALINLILR